MIVVHASPRSGSTYFFSVLRRLPPLVCFNEALSDVFAGEVTKQSIGSRPPLSWDVNHHFLEHDDYHEFAAAWDTVMPYYPPVPAFRDYFPADGVLRRDQRDYVAAFVEYGRTVGKRPVLCDIHSQGRAGCLRDAFGGFHVAQFRDPLSQFGSFYRALAEGGSWPFLASSLLKLGISGDHPLCRAIPEEWRLPVLPWPEGDRWTRWQTQIDYIKLMKSGQAAGLERAFRWHLFAWFLTNIAAIAYSDLVVDIDRVHDEPDHRAALADLFAAELGVAPDFRGVQKFARYYEFEAFDAAAIAGQVVQALRRSVEDGTLDAGVRALSRSAPLTATSATASLLFDKLDVSLAAFQAADRTRVTNAQWIAAVQASPLRWENKFLRGLARQADTWLSTARRRHPRAFRGLGRLP